MRFPAPAVGLVMSVTSGSTDIALYRELDPDVEAAAARRLADEEESIARKHDMCPGWRYDEHQKKWERMWRERRRT